MIEKNISKTTQNRNVQTIPFALSFYFSKIRKKINSYLPHRLRIKTFKELSLVNKVEGNKQIINLILSNKPFVISRFGAVELEIIIEILAERCGLSKTKEESIQLFKNNAGFFSCNKSNIEKYVDLILNNVNKIDYIGYWDLRSQNYILNNYMNKTKIVPFESLEPYRFNVPWSKCLEGKRVLVIHPFAKTIMEQYKKRELLFKNQNILPKFELIAFKSVQSIGGECDSKDYSSWFDALNDMHERIKKIDYDIALIGCGAYGMPLSIMIKEDGKQAIHVGGSLQIMFGIKGKRWEKEKHVQEMINENWCSPLEEEKPKRYLSVENGCYW